MKLTQHFSSEEWAMKDGTPYPVGWIPSRLLPLCNELEVLRDHIGRPIRIISGYRSEAYNRKIGGARLSQHVQGRACDIVVAGLPASAVHQWTLDLYRAGKLKIGGVGLYPNFVHIDVRQGPRLAHWTGSRMG